MKSKLQLLAAGLIVLLILVILVWTSLPSATSPTIATQPTVAPVLTVVNSCAPSNNNRCLRNRKKAEMDAEADQLAWAACHFTSCSKGNDVEVEVTVETETHVVVE
jgi:hypothetical protein